jgi:hypothetical protein
MGKLDKLDVKKLAIIVGLAAAAGTLIYIFVV